MMIGGEQQVVQKLDPIFFDTCTWYGRRTGAHLGVKSIGGTAERGYLHCGANGQATS